MTQNCEECQKKDERITYRTALLALNHLKDDPSVDAPTENIELIRIRQRQEVLKRQLLIVRADVQYLNREVKNVFDWILKVISVFLSCCGRISESTASIIVSGASGVGDHVTRIIGK